MHFHSKLPVLCFPGHETDEKFLKLSFNNQVIRVLIQNQSSSVSRIMFNILQLILSQPATQLFTRQILNFNKLSNNFGGESIWFYSEWFCKMTRLCYRHIGSGAKPQNLKSTEITILLKKNKKIKKTWLTFFEGGLEGKFLQVIPGLNPT